MRTRTARTLKCVRGVLPWPQTLGSTATAAHGPTKYGVARGRALAPPPAATGAPGSGPGSQPMPHHTTQQGRQQASKGTGGAVSPHASQAPKRPSPATPNTLFPLP